MRKLTTIDELKLALNNRYRSEYISTSVKNISQYERMIGDIYLHEDGDDLYILTKKNSFFTVDLLLKRDRDHSLDLVKNLVLEYAYKRKENEKVELIKSLGFKEVATRTLMSSEVVESEALNPTFLGPVWSLKILAEISHNYNYYYGCIPSTTEIINRIANEEVIGIIEDKKLLGFVEIEKKRGKVVGIRHIVVMKEFRRQGIGKKLIRNLYGYAINMGYNRIELFVNDDNLGAKALYGSMGFTNSGAKSIIFRRDTNERTDY